MSVQAVTKSLRYGQTVRVAADKKQCAEWVRSDGMLIFAPFHRRTPTFASASHHETRPSLEAWLMSFNVNSARINNAGSTARFGFRATRTRLQINNETQG
jgi:hypothetical protein